MATISTRATARFVEAGGLGAEDAAGAAAAADVVVTMVPAGRDARQVYLADGVLARARRGSLMVDCSTVDIETASALKSAGEEAGHDMVDAPVSGGPLRAMEGKLAITVGGTEEAFGRARPILAAMATSVHHMGPGGAGIAAKICNNLVLGIELAGLAEAFVLGQRLGLDPAKLFASMSASSGQSWALQELCPIPGPVPTSPASNGYKARGAADLLLKDLGIAEAAARDAKVPFLLGGVTLSLYTMLINAGYGALDVCAIVKMYERPTSQAQADPR